MKITRKTKTTLQFQNNPVWWGILGFAFGSGLFLYNANSKNLVLNKNSLNQATLEVVDRWLGLYETNRRRITDVQDMEIRRHDSKHQMVAITSNGAVPIDKGFSSGIEDSKRFQFVEEAKALLHSPRKGKVSARVSYALLLDVFGGLLLFASLASYRKIQGLLDSEKNLFILQKRHVFGVRKRKIALSQIQSFAIKLTQGKRALASLDIGIKPILKTISKPPKIPKTMRSLRKQHCGGRAFSGRRQSLLPSIVLQTLRLCFLTALFPKFPILIENSVLRKEGER